MVQLRRGTTPLLAVRQPVAEGGDVAVTGEAQNFFVSRHI
jgi:hypothetical protein